MTGLTIWIDNTGRKKESFGIQCPIISKPPSIHRNFMQNSRNTSQWNNNKLLEAKFSGFAKSEEIYFICNNPYKVEVSVSIDKFKSMYYEMKIPFSALYKDYSNLISKTLSIGLETGALKIPSSGNKQARMSNNQSRISNRRKGSNSSSEGISNRRKGSGNSAGISNNSSMMNMTTPTKIWIKDIKLTQQ
jgi:hypothetical protein